VTEPDPTLDEELEAAALRAALDEGRGNEHVPGDALEAASLLRFSGAAGQLSDERSERLRRELLASLPERRTAARRPRILIWLAALGGVGALAALLLTFRQPATPIYADASAPPKGFAPAESAALSPSDVPSPARARAKAPSASAAAPRAAEPLELARNDAPVPWASGGEQHLALPGVDRRARASLGAAGAPPPAAEAEPHAARPPVSRELAAGAPASAAAKAKPMQPGAPALTTRAQLEAARLGQHRELVAKLDAPLDQQVRQAESRSESARSPAQQASARSALITALADTQAASFDETEKRPLQQDLYWRLAELALRQGQPEQALEWTRQGIALDGPPSPFLGLLWQAQGEAHEALGDKEAAAASYLEAQSISVALLRKSIDN
jgi:predicted negative regulator of RcsB-dependent stress response